MVFDRTDVVVVVVVHPSGMYGASQPRLKLRPRQTVGAMTPTANGTLPGAVRRIAELGSATVVLQGKREIREARLLAFAFKNATYEAVDRAMVTDPSAPVLMMHMADGWSGPIVRGPLLALRAFRFALVWPRLQFLSPGWFDFGR